MTADRSTRASLFPMGSTRRGTPADAMPLRGFREKSVVLDAAVDEYLRLQRAGTPVSKEEFCARYPDYRHSLRRLIDVEEALPAFDEIENDFWPEVGGCFLGYDILDLLGAGSIARVFLASEIKLGGRAVAIKVSRHGGYEAETLGKLRHANIVEVYSVNHDDESGLTVVCMPYQGSATLSDLLDAAFRDLTPPLHARIIAEVGRRMGLTDAISEEELIAPEIQRTLERGTYVDGVVHLGMQLASALQYAHDHGVLHRDLKPSNVLLTPQGRPMLLDFNLSFDEALNMVHRGGTLPYSAPEQLCEATQSAPTTTSTVGVAADVFSLGAILYELLTGKLPYGSPPPDIGPRQAIHAQLEAQKTPPVPIRQLNSQVDAHLESIILRCLHIDPTKRFESMTQLEAALREHFQLKHRLRRWVRCHRVLTTSAGAILAFSAAATAAYVVTRPPYHERERMSALQAFEQQDYPRALESLDRSLENNPEYGPSLFLRGVTRQKSKDDAGAILDFQLAKESGYDTEALWSHWGYSLYKSMRMEDVVPHYVAACERWPESANLKIARAYARHISSKDNTRALEELDQVIEDHPERFEGYLFRAVIRFRMLRTSDDVIVRDVENACAKSPPIPSVEFEAAKMLAAAAASNEVLAERAQWHLRRAVQLGWPRRAIETLYEFKQWSNQPWFLELLEQCRAAEGNPEPTLSELAFRPFEFSTSELASAR